MIKTTTSPVGLDNYDKLLDDVRNLRPEVKPDPTTVEVLGPLGPLVVGRLANPPLTLGPPRSGNFASVVNQNGMWNAGAELLAVNSIC